jgi:hypothetical protein
LAGGVVAETWLVVVWDVAGWVVAGWAKATAAMVKNNIAINGINEDSCL